MKIEIINYFKGPDERKLNDTRPYKVTFNCINTCTGSSMIKLGDTAVVCGISARLCRPSEEKPGSGYLICNVELPSLCSTKNMKGLSSQKAASFSQSSVGSVSIEQSQAMLSQLMQDILTESECVKEADLCIREGKLVWALYIDLICLNNDGNVQDACCLAMISALKTVQLYQIDFNEDEDKFKTKVFIIFNSIISFISSIE
jgi:exosome complex component RRP43